MWQTKEMLPYGKFLALRGKEKAKYIELHGESFLERPPGSWEGAQQKWRRDVPLMDGDEWDEAVPRGGAHRSQHQSLATAQEADCKVTVSRRGPKRPAEFRECPWRQPAEVPPLASRPRDMVATAKIGPRPSRCLDQQD